MHIKTNRTGNRSPAVKRRNALTSGFLSVSLCPAFQLFADAADATVWNKAAEILKDIYTQILGISTVAAITTASIALCF